jgi:hypothetical protein
MRLIIFCLVASAVLPSMSRAQTPADVPVFAFSKEESSMKFSVKASVDLEGKFNKWDASMIFTSGCHGSRFGHQDSGSQRGYRKRHEGRQAEEQRLLRRRAGSHDHVSFRQGCADRPHDL